MQFFNQVLVIVLAGLLIQGIKSHLGNLPVSSTAATTKNFDRSGTNVRQLNRFESSNPGAGREFRRQSISPPPSSTQPMVDQIVEIREKMSGPTVSDILSDVDTGPSFQDHLRSVARRAVSQTGISPPAVIRPRDPSAEMGEGLLNRVKLSPWPAEPRFAGHPEQSRHQSSDERLKSR